MDEQYAAAVDPDAERRLRVVEVPALSPVSSETHGRVAAFSLNFGATRRDSAHAGAHRRMQTAGADSPPQRRVGGASARAGSRSLCVAGGAGTCAVAHRGGSGRKMRKNDPSAASTARPVKPIV